MGQRVYVTDSYLGRIQMFDMRGEFLGMLSDATGLPISLTTPTGIAADITNKRLSVVELKRRGLGELVVADLNHDGWLDQNDTIAFMGGVRP